MSDLLSHQEIELERLRRVVRQQQKHVAELSRRLSTCSKAVAQAEQQVRALTHELSLRNRRIAELESK